jgi:cytochrome b
VATIKGKYSGTILSSLKRKKILALDFFVVVFFRLVRVICGLFSFKSARFYSFPPRQLDRIHDSINKNREKEHTTFSSVVAHIEKAVT